MLELVNDTRIYGNPKHVLAERGYSMQVVPSEVKKCVVFISYKDKQQNFQLAGTGFFIGYPLDDPNYQVTYLVTARHVIGGISTKSVDGQVYIRVNTTSGSTTTAISPISQWQYHSDSTVDAAVISWTPQQSIFDYLPLPISMAVTSDVMVKHNIDAGDEVFLTGLFSNHYGQQKNLPIIRTGSIALISDEKIETNSPYGAMEAYLIEARSIGGLSGSPVFAYLGSMRSNNQGSIAFGGAPLFLWLGLMHGHWDVDESQIDTEIDSAGAVGRNVNMGIGIVVPATKIIEIIEQEGFVAERKKANEQIKSSKGSTMDSLPETTKSEFENVLKKVSRKTNPEQPGTSATKT